MFLKLILIFAFLGCALGINAQCIATDTDPCVPVHQSLLDRMAKVADEYKAAQEAIAKQAAALAATESERAAVKAYMATVDSTFAILQKGIADRETVIALQDKALKAFADLADKLMAQINKPKSAFSKFMQTLKEVALLATGAIIGGGL